MPARAWTCSRFRRDRAGRYATGRCSWVGRSWRFGRITCGRSYEGLLDGRVSRGKTSPVTRLSKPVYMNLDDAWDATDGFDVVDVRAWGPRLRYHGRRGEVEAFYEEIRGRLGDFTLYGSGDFHYLAAVLLRRVAEPATVVSFDNHPDWDIRPPYWACGGWVNRALALPNVRRVSV